MVTATRESSTTHANTRFDIPADESRVRTTIGALEANGFTVIRAANGDDAREKVLDLIPDGSQVHHGASKTLDQTGLTEALADTERYDALKPRIWSMDRQTQAHEIRRLGAAPDVMLGSVHAVTETGSLIVASMGGSQLGPYVSGAGKLVLVVGTQKIVADLDEGFRRLYEHTLPLESERVQAAYGIDSSVNKLLVINREIQPGRITVVLVDEALGF